MTTDLPDRDPSPPMRIGEVLAMLGLPVRFGVRVDAGADEEGNLTLQCTCDCGTLTEVTLQGWTSRSTPGEVAYTCARCWTSHWLVVG